MKTLSTQTRQRWWLDVNGRPDGPHATEAILADLQSGRMAPTTRACPEGGAEWRPLTTWPEWSSWTSISASESSTATDLRTLSIWHRRFTLGILAIMLGAFLLQAIDSTPLTIFGLLATSFLQVLLTVGLCRALGFRSYVFWAIVTAVPFIGAIPLFLISRKATKRLKAAGISVGLLGAKTT